MPVLLGNCERCLKEKECNVSDFISLGLDTDCLQLWLSSFS